MEKKCIVCDCSFITSFKRVVACSDECKKQYESDRYKRGKIHITYVCINCNTEYHPKDLDRNKFCSRDCAFEYKTNQRLKKEEEFNYKKIDKNKRICKICGNCFVATNANKNDSYCYKEECNKEYYLKERQHKKTIQEYICKECGQSFTPEYGDKRTVFCSSKCQSKCEKKLLRKTDKYKEYRRNMNKNRRAKKRGAFVSKVIRQEIFDRDKWICQLCFKRVDKNLSYPHMMSASLDHIIPIAKGGTHEPKNCQLAHFICNSRKSDGAMNEQLRIC